MHYQEERWGKYWNIHTYNITYVIWIFHFQQNWRVKKDLANIFSWRPGLLLPKTEDRLNKPWNCVPAACQGNQPRQAMSHLKASLSLTQKETTLISIEEALAGLSIQILFRPKYTTSLISVAGWRPTIKNRSTLLLTQTWHFRKTRLTRHAQNIEMVLRTDP